MALPTFKQFLDKLNKIEWTSPDGDLVGSYSKEYVGVDKKLKLSYSIETMTSLHDKDVPFKAIIHVRYKGKTVTHWGCVSNAENAEFLEWWIKKQRVINDNITKRDRVERKEGEKLWKNV